MIHVLFLSFPLLLSLDFNRRLRRHVRSSSIIVMSSGERLSREHKGKAVATGSSPARDTAGDPLAELDVIHRKAMMDTTNMDTPQRALVVESTRQLREENENTASGAQDCARDGGAIDGEIAPPDSVPTCYHQGEFLRNFQHWRSN